MDGNANSASLGRTEVSATQTTNRGLQNLANGSSEHPLDVLPSQIPPIRSPASNQRRNVATGRSIMFMVTTWPYPSQIHAFRNLHPFGITIDAKRHLTSNDNSFSCSLSRNVVKRRILPFENLPVCTLRAPASQRRIAVHWPIVGH